MVLAAGLVSALTLYAFIVRRDFRTAASVLIVFILSFVMLGVGFAFTGSTLHRLYAVLGCILGGTVLVLDAQWVADGDRGCSLDDPWMGVLIIYIDTIRVFLYLLQSIGSSQRN
jgi:FtsH-binding integral membrane protein